MADFIINYWQILVIIVALIVVAIEFAIRFSKQPASDKLDQVKSWLLYAVTEAEKELGSGTGKVKLSYVYNLFITKFPAVAAVVSYDTFSTLVDEVLEEFNKLLSSNKSLQEYVGEEKEAE